MKVVTETPQASTCFIPVIILSARPFAMIIIGIVIIMGMFFPFILMQYLWVLKVALCVAVLEIMNGVGRPSHDGLIFTKRFPGLHNCYGPDRFSFFLISKKFIYKRRLGGN